MASFICRIQSRSAATASLSVLSIVHLVFLTTLYSQLHQSINKHFASILKRSTQKIMSDTGRFSDPVDFLPAIYDSRLKLF